MSARRTTRTCASRPPPAYEEVSRHGAAASHAVKPTTRIWGTIPANSPQRRLASVLCRGLHSCESAQVGTRANTSRTGRRSSVIGISWFDPSPLRRIRRSTHVRSAVFAVSQCEEPHASGCESLDAGPEAFGYRYSLVQLQHSSERSIRGPRHARFHPLRWRREVRNGTNGSHGIRRAEASRLSIRLRQVLRVNTATVISAGRRRLRLVFGSAPRPSSLSEYAARRPRRREHSSRIRA